MIGVLMKSENLDTDRQTVGEGHVRMKVQTKQCVHNPKSSKGWQPACRKLGDSPPQTQKEAALRFHFWIFLWLGFHSDCGTPLQYPQETST